MIIGVGTDICKIDRIKVSEDFAKRILTEVELAVFASKNESQRQSFLAKRFSAKESIAKALGCGIRGNLSFQDITIVNDDKGKPFVELLDTARLNLPQFNNIHISISDEKDYVVTFAVVES